MKSIVFFAVVLTINVIQYADAECYLEPYEREAIDEEFALAIEVAMNGISPVLAITYLIFSILGFVIAVWHVNDKLAASENAGLPRYFSAVVRRYKRYQKVLVKRQQKIKAAKGQSVPGNVPPASEILTPSQQKERNIQEMLKSPAKPCNYEMIPLGDLETPSQRKERNIQELLKNPSRPCNYEMIALEGAKPLTTPTDQAMNTKKESVAESKVTGTSTSNLASNVPPPPPPAKLHVSKQESFDTIRQAIERDRLEEEHRKAQLEATKTTTKRTG